jgi:hypothetical protein
MQHTRWVPALAGMSALPTTALPVPPDSYELLLNEGVQANILQQPSGNEMVAAFEGQDMLKVHVQLSGHRSMTFEKRHEISLRGAATALLMHDDGVRKIDRLLATQESRSLTIAMRRSQLMASAVFPTPIQICGTYRRQLMLHLHR